MPQAIHRILVSTNCVYKLSICPALTPQSCSISARRSSHHSRAITLATFCIILDAEENGTFVSVIGCWKFYTVADCIVNVKEAMHELKSMALNGCWKKLWSEGLNNLQRFPNQEDE
jgi:hypothetical protein